MCRITGINITSGGYTRTNITNGTKPSIELLSKNKVVIVYNKSQKLYAIVYEVLDNLKVTAGLEKELNATSYSSQIISVVALSKNRIFIIHNSDNNLSYMYGILCKIEGTSIIVRRGCPIRNNS